MPDYLQKVPPENAHGVMATSGWHADIIKFKGARAQILNDQYKREYSNGVNMDEFSANGWMNASLMIDVLERAGSLDKGKIRQTFMETNISPDHEVLSLHAFEGIRFDQEIDGMKNQNPYGNNVIIQAVGDNMVMVGPTTFAGEDKFLWPVQNWQ